MCECCWGEEFRGGCQRTGESGCAVVCCAGARSRGVKGFDSWGVSGLRLRLGLGFRLGLETALGSVRLTAMLRTLRRRGSRSTEMASPSSPPFNW